MKKILVTTMLAFVSCLLIKAYASTVMVDYYGETFVSATGVERNMLINSDDTRECDIVVRPLGEGLRRNDGFVIPLENVFINNTHEDVYFRTHEYTNLFRRITLGGVQKPITAKIRDYGMVPAGTYSLPFEFQALDSETQGIIGTTVFNIQFIVPTTQQISFNGENPRIAIGVKEAFVKNRPIPNENNPIVYINSNCDWVLYLNTERFGEEAGTYYVRVISSSANVTESLRERIQLYPNTEIFIARGKAPANNEYLALEFAVEGKDGKIIKSGTYRSNLRFILKEDRR